MRLVTGEPAERVQREGRRDKRGRRIGHNWWREYVWDIWYGAEQQWLAERERVCLGYPTEEADYSSWEQRGANPIRPTFKSILVQCAGLKADAIGDAA